MENLNNYIVSYFPFEEYSKVSDILYYDGPILSHFIDKSGQNLLLSWIDYDEVSNRWLIIPISENQLFQYLSKKVSLLELFDSLNNQFIFFADINENFEIEKTYILAANKIPKKYIPDKNSFYHLEPEEIYDPIFNKYKVSDYIDFLRQKAFYFKLEPLSGKFENSVAIDYIIGFLSSVKQSFSKYVYFDFMKNFQGDYSDQNKLERTIRQLNNHLQPRLVDAEYGSFSAGIASDYLMLNSSDKKIIDWKKDVFNNYKTDVFEIDYNSEKEIEHLNEKFNITQRIEIYKPILKAFSSNKYDVYSTEKNYTPLRKIKLKQKVVKRIIQPKMIEELPKTEKRILIKTILEVPLDKDNIPKITKRTVDEGILFQEKINHFEKPIFSILFPNGRIVLKQAIICIISEEKSEFNLVFNNLDISIYAENVEELLKIFNSIFYNLYKKLVIDEAKIENESDKKYKTFFDKIVDYID